MEVRLSTTCPPPADVAAAAEVYGSAFGGPPYHEPAEMTDAFVERVERYARDREGFRLVTAVGDAGRMFGIGLAVTARPGDAWREGVARAIPDLVERWLGDRCLEVVHIAVTASEQGQGIGRLVHDVLIAGRPAPTGLLTVHPEAAPARALYESSGWTLLTDALPTHGPDFRLMGRDL
jgi:GNAT superfamily N-acetyltransferase